MSLRDLDELFKPQETAQALHISVRTLPRWEAAGLLYPVRLSNRVVRYRASDIKRLIEGGGTGRPAVPKGQAQ